ncbi:MAG TPA: hypothetical protein VF803_02145 [Candidatus Paceibacterota bacterium]
MTTSAAYAHALFELSAKEPERGETYVRNLVSTLKRRGHSKLLPRIFAEYQKLALKKERVALHTRVTPEKERTRILLELYRTLLTA